MQGDKLIPHTSPTSKSSMSYTVATNSANFEEERNSLGNLNSSYLVGILNKDYESNGPANKRARLEPMGENRLPHHNGEAGSSSAINVHFDENDDYVANDLGTEHLSSNVDNDGSPISNFRFDERRSNLGENSCSLSKLSNKVLEQHIECESVEHVTDIVQPNNRSGLNQVSDNDEEETNCHIKDTLQKEQRLTKQNVSHQNIDKYQKDGVINLREEAVVEKCSNVFPVSHEHPKNTNQDAEDYLDSLETDRSFDSSTEESPRSPTSSRLSTSDRQHAVTALCYSFEGEKNNEALETISKFSGEQKSIEESPLAILKISQALPISNVESSNNVQESFDSSEMSTSENGSSPDSAQDCLADSISNCEGQQVHPREDACNSEAIPSKQKPSEEVLGSDFTEDSQTILSAESNFEVHSTSFSVNLEVSLPLSGTTPMLGNDFSKLPEETKSATSELTHTSSPDSNSNCILLNDEVGESPTDDNATVCSSNRLENDDVSEGSSSESILDNRNYGDDACEQSVSVINPVTQVISTTLPDKESEDDDSC